MAICPSVDRDTVLAHSGRLLGMGSAPPAHRDGPCAPPRGKRSPITVQWAENIERAAGAPTGALDEISFRRPRDNDSGGISFPNMTVLS
jgi:hypothetical protein